MTYFHFSHCLEFVTHFSKSQSWFGNQLITEYTYESFPEWVKALNNLIAPALSTAREKTFLFGQ